MRIPSQFNDDSLYRGGKRSASASGPSYRRLFRLFVAFVLVVLVMREAARPQLYETFFGDPPPASDPVSAVATSSMPSVDGADVDTAADTGTSAAQLPFRAESDRLVKQMTVDQQRDLLSSIIASVNGPERDDPEFVDTERDRLRTFLDHHDRSDRERALVQSLAEAAMNRAVDGSVWRSEDVDALYYQLATAQQVDAADTASVSVLLLVQQPDVYRGQAVRFRGSVMRCQSVAAAKNAFGITQYWQLWLRPSDGGDRPLVAVVPHVPEKIESAKIESVADDDQPVEVEIIGRFLKRLAYRSSIGADTAPVIVGSLKVIASDATLPPATNTQAEIPKTRMILGIAIACLIGLALAAITMWRTAVTSRRARALRQSNTIRSETFLRELSDVEHDARNQP